MLQWNELRVSPNGKYIILDLSVQHLDFYNDIYIGKIYMDAFKNPDDFISPMPTSKSIEIYTNEDTDIKYVRKYIDIDSISDNIFFLYAIAEGTVADDTPCECKDPLLVGIVYNEKLIYDASILKLTQIDNCKVNKGLIDFIFKEKAFNLALKTGDYKSLIQYWNILTKESKVINISNCKCDGY